MRVKNNVIYFAASFLLLLILIILLGFLPVYKAVGKTGTVKPAPQTHGYSILIDTQAKNLYLLENGKLVKRYKCAVGKSETPSPLGSYKIIEKSHWGEGFGGYWLGINCPWGTYGIHGTTTPDSIGSSASHGCFRMFNSDVKELYNAVPVGTPVLITGGIYGDFGSGFRAIGPGMYGRDVQVVQMRLRDLGYFSGECNGRYDSSGFRSAVHHFQKDNNLPVSDTITKNMLEALGFVLMD